MDGIAEDNDDDEDEEDDDEDVDEFGEDDVDDEDLECKFLIKLLYWWMPSILFAVKWGDDE